MEHGITWSHLFLSPLEHLLASWGVDPIAGSNAVIVAVLVVIFAFFAGRRFRKEQMVEPEGRPTFTFLAEFIVDGLMKLFGTIMEKKVKTLFPVLGTFALFIITCNLIGLVPGFLPPTDQFNVTLPLALITFVVAHTIGIREHGSGYVKKFMGPLWYMAPLMLPIELISHLVRPLSLSIRLFGNMTGDHRVVLVFSSLVALGLPVPFMGLGVLVSVLQTLIFILLSAVYFQDALEHPH